MIWGILLPIGLLVGLALLERFTGWGEELGDIGTGLATFGQGIQKFISSVFSPQITPTFLPTIGLDIRLPWAGIGEPISQTVQGMTMTYASAKGWKTFRRAIPPRQRIRPRPLPIRPPYWSGGVNA